MYKIELFYPETNTSIFVYPTKDDFVGFLWEKEFKVKFIPGLYKFEDKGGRFYKEVSTKWENNELPEFELADDADFKNYLMDKYVDEAYDAYLFNRYIEEGPYFLREEE